MRSPLVPLAFVTLIAACRRTSPEPPTHGMSVRIPIEDPENDPLPVVFDAGPPPSLPPPPSCTVDATHWFLPVTDHEQGDPVVEGGALFVTPGGAWGTWIDPTVPSALVVQPPAGSAFRDPLGAGETEAPVLAPAESGAVIAAVTQQPRARVHRVWLARAGAMRQLFTQPETRDDGLSISTVATSAGVLLAWDDDRPSPRHGGSIVVQFISHESLVAGTPIVPLPPTRVVSPDTQDAANPVLIAMPNGTATVAWLSAQQLDAAEANQSSADIFVRALSADGTPTHDPIQITPGPGIRFGITGLARGTALWIAYRVAGDADQETQGDGGSLAVLRLGADLRPSASPAYVTDEHAVPSGLPTLVADGGAVSVFWTERDGDGVHTLRRPVEPDGRAARRASSEPALGGDLPVAGDVGNATVLRHGPRGEPGMAQAHCSASAMVPVPTRPRT